MVSVFPCALVACGITLPWIGQDKLISDRAIGKLLWSAFRSPRQFFFLSLFLFVHVRKAKTSEYAEMLTQLLWTGLPDLFSLHVDVEVCS